LIALAGAFAQTALAFDQPPAKPELPLVSIERQGYAFEFPRVLAQQRLFGIAHGVSLLAASCLDVKDKADAAADAYSKWRDQQEAAIDRAEHELAHFYFGARADEAEWSHIVRALNLRESLGMAPDSEQLSAACATLPTALQQPRYDLAAMLRLEEAMAAVVLNSRVETQVKVCAARLPEVERPKLQQRLTEWQAKNAQLAVQAQAQLQSIWQATPNQKTADAWLQTLPTRFSNPPAATCMALPEWLQSRAASLAANFELPPDPVVASIPHEDNVVLPVVPAEVLAPLPPPEQEASPIATLTPVAVEHDGDSQAQSYPNLFDFVMRLFDERSNDSTEDPSVPTRARSPRAYP
jgi:hypothetical protein